MLRRRLASLAAATLAVCLTQPLPAQMPPGSEQYRSGDYATAFPLLLTAAENGDPVAQFLVGESYTEAHGVLRNNQQAEHWFTQARRPDLLTRLSAPASSGDALAQTILGICSEQGVESAPSPDAAITWYRKAAKQGYAQAQINLGSLLRANGAPESHLQEAFAWFEKAANQGHPMAIYNVGVAYNEGTGVTQNYAQAAEYFSRAADLGYPGAQFNLGVAYLKGRGVGQDEARAVELFRSAAQEAYLPAQFSLALSYFTGNGTAKNPVRAYYWARLASIGGHPTGPRLTKDAAALLTPKQIREVDSQIAAIVAQGAQP